LIHTAVTKLYRLLYTDKRDVICSTAFIIIVGGVMDREKLNCFDGSQAVQLVLLVKVRWTKTGKGMLD
jgi:hypothetical protein